MVLQPRPRCCGLARCASGIQAGGQGRAFAGSYFFDVHDPDAAHRKDRFIDDRCLPFRIGIVSEAAVALWRLLLKKVLLLLMLVALPCIAQAADPALDQPNWSFEIKGGKFAPELANWAQFYGSRDMPEYAMAIAYKIKRQIEIGVEGGFLEDRGHAYAPLHQTAAGRVIYNLYPVNAFVLFRGVFDENQWIVPYAGGGYTKMFYREKIEGQDTVSGSANGYHARGGLQFLLDGLDQSAANGLYMDYGVFHTYFFIEAKYTRAVVSGTNIGGTSYLGGLLFEF